jgi:hypothetical protein
MMRSTASLGRAGISTNNRRTYKGLDVASLFLGMGAPSLVAILFAVVA